MTMKSGHCLDNLCHRCTWPRCTHSCHASHVAEMVAQTFDRGALLPVISGRIESADEVRKHPAGEPSNTPESAKTPGVSNG